MRLEYQIQEAQPGIDSRFLVVREGRVRSLRFRDHGTRLIFHSRGAESMKVFPFTKGAQRGRWAGQGHRASKWQCDPKARLS